jgi:putative spermidine/putrescine transport system ATP-binding protein
MQVELKTLQREVGITFIYVTHDQEEALTMSDRLAVFNHGRVEQVGAPQDVYENPANTFVAGFVGTSNVVPGDVALRLTGSAQPFTVRPEKIHINDASAGEVSARGIVSEVQYLGMFTRYRVDIGDAAIEAVMQNVLADQTGRHQIGDRVSVSWSKDSCRQLSDDGAGPDEGALLRAAAPL